VKPTGGVRGRPNPDGKTAGRESAPPAPDRPAVDPIFRLKRGNMRPQKKSVEKNIHRIYTDYRSKMNPIVIFGAPKIFLALWKISLYL
jgi:hypothetical protein